MMRLPLLLLGVGLSYGATSATYGSTGCQQASRRPLHYLDRHQTDCPAGSALHRFQFGTHDCSEDREMKFRTQCPEVEGLGECSIRFTECQAAKGQTLEQLGAHAADCGAGSVLSSWRMVQGSCADREQQMEYTCCKKADFTVTSEMVTECGPARREELQYLDRFDVECAGWSVMQAFHFTSDGCPTSGDMRFAYRCVAPVNPPTPPPSMQFSSQYFPDELFQTMDYGLYFWGKKNAYDKYIAGEENKFFDPTKPTVIYVHGRVLNGMPEHRRPTLDTDGYAHLGAPAGVDMAALWIDRGYNVASFYYSCFADESSEFLLQVKLWSGNGELKQRWRDDKGEYHEGPTGQSVGQLFADQFEAAFTTAAPVRVVGLSLGAQVALSLAKELLARNAVLPRRVVLLDHVFVHGEMEAMGGRTASSLANEAAKGLKKQGVVLEALRTSVTHIVPHLDGNYELNDLSAFMELRNWFFNFWQIWPKHEHGLWWYFMSIEQDPAPTEPDHHDDFPTYALGANVPDNVVRFWMESNYRLYQTEGINTEDVGDDVFDVRTR